MKKKKVLNKSKKQEHIFIKLKIKIKIMPYALDEISNMDLTHHSTQLKIKA